jgi:hypothetical protein
LLLAVLVAALSVTFATAQEKVPNWPVEILRDDMTVIVYSPQIDAFEGDSLTARAAIAVTPKSTNKTSYGAAWIVSRTATDLDERMVTLTSGRVPKIKLPNTAEGVADRARTIIDEALQSNTIVISLDKLVTSLAVNTAEVGAAGSYNTDAPKIIVLNYPAVLIPLDGEVKLTRVEGYNLEEAQNTPFFLVKESSTGTLYMKGGPFWYRGTMEEDPPKFELAQTAPQEVIAYYRSIASEEDLAADTAKADPSKARSSCSARSPPRSYRTTGSLT